jgi:hypothetical protein
VLKFSSPFRQLNERTTSMWRLAWDRTSTGGPAVETISLTSEQLGFPRECAVEAPSHDGPLAGAAKTVTKISPSEVHSSGGSTFSCKLPVIPPGWLESNVSKTPGFSRPGAWMTLAHKAGASMRPARSHERVRNRQTLHEDKLWEAG